MNTLTATRDAILTAPRASTHRTYVSTDTAGWVYEVVGAAAPGQVFARSERTGLLVLVTRTGRVRNARGLVRVRVDFPTDTGDAAGTLAFDGGHVGGHAPADLF